MLQSFLNEPTVAGNINDDWLYLYLIIFTINQLETNHGGFWFVVCSIFVSVFFMVLYCSLKRGFSSRLDVQFFGGPYCA